MKRSARPIYRDGPPRCAAASITTARLYELIWIRTIASQMKPRTRTPTTVDIAAKRPAPHMLKTTRATGQVVKFDGFLTLARSRKARTTTATTRNFRRPPAMSAKANP